MLERKLTYQDRCRLNLIDNVMSNANNVLAIYNDYLVFITSGYWHFSTAMCNVFITADVLMCTSSILHLCSISVQRYLAISRPLKWRNKSKSIVVTKIGLIWVAAIVISSPVSILGALDSGNILNSRQCVLKNHAFIIYGSILAFFIPLVIMVISYALTTRLLYKKSKLRDPEKDGFHSNNGTPIIRRSKSARRKQIETSLACADRHHFECFKRERMNNNSKSVDVYRNIRGLSPEDIKRPCDSLSVSKPGSSESMVSTGEVKCFLQVPNVHAFKTSTESLPLNPDNTDTDCEISEDDQSRSYSMSLTQFHPPGSPGKSSIRSTILFKASSFLNLSRQDKRSDKSTVRTEQKASKVLGLVFALFLLSWLPFFILNILPVICADFRAHPLVTSTFSWLGWASSTINPIIYTSFNKTFKRAFIDILLCKYSCKKESAKKSPSYVEGKRIHEPACIKHSTWDEFGCVRNPYTFVSFDLLYSCFSNTVTRSVSTLSYLNEIWYWLT